MNFGALDHTCAHFVGYGAKFSKINLWMSCFVGLFRQRLDRI